MKKHKEQQQTMNLVSVNATNQTINYQQPKFNHKPTTTKSANQQLTNRRINQPPPKQPTHQSINHHSP